MVCAKLCPGNHIPAGRLALERLGLDDLTDRLMLGKIEPLINTDGLGLTFGLSHLCEFIFIRDSTHSTILFHSSLGRLKLRIRPTFNPVIFK